MIDIFSQPTFHKILVILAFIGAKLAGGRFCTPLFVRVILDTIPGRGLKCKREEGKMYGDVKYPRVPHKVG